MSGIADDAQRQSSEEHWANERVKAWGRPQPNDYDFSSWTKGAKKERLQAGCVYEFARESRKLRCLLALMNPQRKRESWEITTAPGGERIQLDVSFEDLHEKGIERMLPGGWLYCLADLADALAENKSFADLFTKKRGELEKAFGGLNELERVHREHRYFHPVPSVWPAWQAELRLASAWETLLKKNSRIIRDDGSEIIALRIRWRGCKPREIGKDMEKFARAFRPQPTEHQVDPDSLNAALKDLSVMRIWKREHNPWKRLELVAKICRYSGCREEAAEYKVRREQGHGDEPMSKRARTEMSKARKGALYVFQSLFPGEKPSNW